MKRYWIVFILWLLISSLTLAQMPIEDELYAYVMNIEGKTNIGRGEFIKDQLQKMGVGFVSSPFKKVNVKSKDTTIINGENIIVRLGQGKMRMVVGAHYDAFPESPGANDNGTGVAVMLALINHLENIDWKHAVDFCFFDLEEMGSLGAIDYIRKFVVPNVHLAMINLDVMGTGDEVFVGPLGNYNRFLMRYINESARKTGYTVVSSAVYPGSDFEPFEKMKLENISISVVPAGDGIRLSKYIQNNFEAEPENMPKILDVMHTVDDRSNFVSPSSLKIAYEFTKTLLIAINEARFTPPPIIPKKETGKKR